MTLIAAPGTTARTRWSALIAAALVFAVLLVPAPASAAMLSTATATPTPTPTAALSGEVTLVLAPAANGLLTAGQASAATVELDNGTASTAAGGTATLTIGAAALAERTALAAWLSGDAATPPGASLGTAALAPTASGASSSAAIAIAADDPAIAGRASGVYPLEATLALPDGRTLSARSVLVVPSPTPAATPVGVVVPVTAGPLASGLLTADQLTDLTATGGSLTALLDAVDGTGAILAIDPAIPAAIRALGSRVPASASTWLARLNAMPNTRFALQFGDADVATQLAAGVPAPLQPTSLAGYLSTADFVAPPGISAVTPAPAATPAPSATPATAPSAAPRSSTTLPATDDLLALTASRDSVYWPPSGSATPDVVTGLAALGTTAAPALTLVPSATTSAADATTVPVRGTTGSGELLVSDSEISTALTSAATQGDGIRRGASLAAATAYGVLATAAGTPVLAALDRAAVDGGVSQAALHAAIAAAAGIPGATTASLSTVSTAAPAPVTITAAAVDPARVDATRALLAGSDRIARFATVLEDPTLLTGPERASVLQLLGVAWLTPGVDWNAALSGHRDQVSATLGSVSIVPPSPVNLLSADSGMRVWLRNDLPYPVSVVLHAQPDDLRLEIQRTTALRIEASSNSPVEVPVTARVGSGELSVRLSLTSPTGETIGGPATVDVTVRAEWEGIGIVVLAVIVGVLLVLGVIRTVLRRRARRSEPDAPGKERP